MSSVFVNFSHKMIGATLTKLKAMRATKDKDAYLHTKADFYSMTVRIATILPEKKSKHLAENWII